MNTNQSRRKFIATAVSGAMASVAAPAALAVESAKQNVNMPTILSEKVFGSNDCINVAVLGVNGRGVSYIKAAMQVKGAGDSFYSIMRGTKANLIIRQDAEQGYTTTLYIEPLIDINEKMLSDNLAKVQAKYPGID